MQSCCSLPVPTDFSSIGEEYLSMEGRVTIGESGGNVPAASLGQEGRSEFCSLPSGHHFQNVGRDIG